MTQTCKDCSESGQSCLDYAYEPVWFMEKFDSRGVHKVDKKKHGKGIRLDIILFVVGVILLGIYGIITFKQSKEDEAFEATIEELYQMRDSEILEAKNNKRGPYDALFDANSDMVGWLEVPGTNIDYPVMQTKDDEEYYLHRNFFGKDDKNGTLFLDARSDLNEESGNIIVYGHNMKSGAMFGSLEEYLDQSYEAEHSKINFYTKTEKREYEIISVFQSKIYSNDDENFKYYNCIKLATEEKFDDFYQNIKALSIYDTGVTAQFGDEFITFSTCSYHTKNGRLVVVGKQID